MPPIVVTCPRCKARLGTSTDGGDASVECPTCKVPIPIPVTDPPPAERPGTRRTRRPREDPEEFRALRPRGGSPVKIILITLAVIYGSSCMICGGLFLLGSIAGQQNNPPTKPNKVR